MTASTSPDRSIKVFEGSKAYSELQIGCSESDNRHELTDVCIDQRRIEQHHDTHLHRLGPNYHLIPVNSPQAAREMSYQWDGFMRVDAGGGGGPAGRHPFAFPNDDFVQPGDLYRKVMTDMDRDHLVGNIAASLKPRWPRLPPLPPLRGRASGRGGR